MKHPIVPKHPNGEVGCDKGVNRTFGATDTNFPGSFGDQSLFSPFAFGRFLYTVHIAYGFHFRLSTTRRCIALLRIESNDSCSLVCTSSRRTNYSTRTPERKCFFLFLVRRITCTHFFGEVLRSFCVRACVCVSWMYGPSKQVGLWFSLFSGRQFWHFSVHFPSNNITTLHRDTTKATTKTATTRRVDSNNNMLSDDTDDQPQQSSSVSLGSLSQNEAAILTNATMQMDWMNEQIVADREARGLCIQCGKQLFSIQPTRKMSTTSLFRKKKKETPPVRKIPLSIPGQVERGQCLQCGTTSSSTATTHDNDSPNSSVSSEREPEMDASRGNNHHWSSFIGGNNNNNNNNASYEGCYNVYGERDGNGTMTWTNGDVYKGEFFNGNRHGQGTLTFADGSEYVGQWECNLQHGVGTRRWNNGDCYTGQYVNGKRTGEGRFYFSNGDMYVGGFDEGVIHGFGRYYYASGQRFEGDFVQGKRRGKGKLQRTDGSLDIGVYKNDVRFGIGVRWSADRTQAWKLVDGIVKKKIPIPEAVALDYDIDAAAQALENNDGVV